MITLCVRWTSFSLSYLLLSRHGAQVCGSILPVLIYLLYIFLLFLIDSRFSGRDFLLMVMHFCNFFFLPSLCCLHGLSTSQILGSCCHHLKFVNPKVSSMYFGSMYFGVGEGFPTTIFLRLALPLTLIFIIFCWTCNVQIELHTRFLFFSYRLSQVKICLRFFVICGFHN